MKDKKMLIDAQESSQQPPTNDTNNQTSKNSRFNRWLPTPGNMIFTLLIVSALFWAQNVGALPMRSPSATSSSTISYQGRLADTSGNPLTGQYNMEFRIYNVATGGSPLWQESWTGGNSVQISDGLFNVMLGSINNTLTSAIADHNDLYLGITVGTDSEMSPRVQLGSVPYSFQAQEALTVADGAITTDKIADGAVTSEKLAAETSGTFGGRPSSFPYLLHLRHFGLKVGNWCFGYVPGDPADIDPSNCNAYSGLHRFTSGLTLYVPSGNGYVASDNNLPWLDVDFESQTVNQSSRWGYAYTFFLNNPNTARSITLPVTTCNDVAIYVTTGTVQPNTLGDNVSQEYHRFPGNDSNSDLQACSCSGNLNPTINVPAGSLRLTMLTRGAHCTSYLVVGGSGYNWIQNANLEIDWPNMRAYLGEQ